MREEPGEDVGGDRTLAVGGGLSGGCGLGRVAVAGNLGGVSEVGGEGKSEWVRQG